MTEDMPERIIGIFGSFTAPNSIPGFPIMGCCTANASQGIYYAWEGAVRCNGNCAQINLLVNRSSSLLDMESYLPYEGKVVIHNKRSSLISIRILSWMDRKKISLNVSGLSRPLNWVGNYLVVDELKPGDELTVTFPVPESKCSYTANHRVWRKEKVYNFKFKGSTVVDVTPKDNSTGTIPIFEREFMNSPDTPIKKSICLPGKTLLNW